MLQRIPGFDIRSDDDARGLGQASSNALVNGKRLSGKSDGTISQDSRISASDVVRIEIVDGATLDVPGLFGQVAYLIVTVSKISGQFEWYSQYRPLIDTLYYLAYAQNHGTFSDIDTMWAVVVFAILASILIHGVTTVRFMNSVENVGAHVHYGEATELASLSPDDRQPNK